jgi:hypothetical protein
MFQLFHHFQLFGETLKRWTSKKFLDLRKMSRMIHRWITEPTLYPNEITTILRSLPPTTVYTSPLSSGRVRYETTTSLSPDVRDVLHQISYVPVTLSLTDVPTDEVDRSRWLQGIQNVLQARITELTGITVTSFNLTTYQDPEMILITPMTRRGVWDIETAIYVGHKEIDAVVTQCHLPLIRGFDLVSTHPLTGYILDAIQPLGANWEIRSDGQAVLTRVPLGDVSAQHYLDYLDLKTRVGFRIHALTEAGYFAIPIETETDVDLHQEMAAFWATQLISEVTIPPLDPTAIPTPQLVLQTNAATLFNQPAATWWQRASLEIKNELFPSVLITGSWIEGSDSTGDNRAKLKYAANLALAQIALTNPWVLRYADRLTVGDDLSVSVMLSRVSEATEFRQKLDFYLSTSSSWTIIGCRGTRREIQRECLTRRWKIVQSYPELHPMMVTIPGYGSYIVVDTTSTTPIFPDSTEPFLVAPEEVEALTHTFREYALTIEPNLPPSWDLIDLVQHNAPIDYLDPLSGWYSVGPISGLFPTVPRPPPLDLSNGTIIVMSERVPEPEPEPEPEVQTVLIELKDGRLIDLFQIWTAETSTLRTICQKLWSQGWFLTPWAAVVQQFTDQPSVMIPRSIPILQRASISPEAGAEALAFLQNEVKLTPSVLIPMQEFAEAEVPPKVGLEFGQAEVQPLKVETEFTKPIQQQQQQQQQQQLIDVTVKPTLEEPMSEKPALGKPVKRPTLTKSRQKSRPSIQQGLATEAVS